MLKLHDIVTKALMPAAEKPGGPVSTTFEIDLETRFNSLRGQGYSHLIVDLLECHNVEGYDYQFIGIPEELPLIVALPNLNKPVITLNLRRDFNAQWPANMVGTVSHPRDLADNPVQTEPAVNRLQRHILQLVR